MMSYLQRGLVAIILTVAAVVALNTEIGTETVVQAYYTHEPLMYEKTFVREGTAKRWQWGFPPRVTVPQIQYGIKNADSVEGEFVVSVSFDNGSERRTENRRVSLGPGQEKTVVVRSPIRRPQSYRVGITAPSKQVEHFREIEVPYKVYEKLWQLRLLSRFR